MWNEQQYIKYFGPIFVHVKWVIEIQKEKINVWIYNKWKKRKMAWQWCEKRYDRVKRCIHPNMLTQIERERERTKNVLEIKQGMAYQYALTKVLYRSSNRIELKGKLIHGWRLSLFTISNDDVKHTKYMKRGTICMRYHVECSHIGPCLNVGYIEKYMRCDIPSRKKIYSCLHFKFCQSYSFHIFP